jgi:hypothetical protein
VKALITTFAVAALLVPATVKAAPFPGIEIPVDPHSLRGKIIAYGESHMGKRIGGGECTDFVNAALAAAGAKQIDIEKTPASLVKAGYPAQTYVWGRAEPIVPKQEEILGVPVLPKGLPDLNRLAGAILQFEDCTFKKPDGTQTWSMPHHSAIVKSAHGTVVTLLQQNAPTGGPVSETTLDLKWLQKATDGKTAVLKAYYPVEK